MEALAHSLDLGNNTAVGLGKLAYVKPSNVGKNGSFQILNVYLGRSRYFKGLP